MSEDYQHHNQGIFSFAPPPSGFERAADDHHDEPQIRRDKLRLPEFGAEPPHHQLVGLEPPHPGVYEPAGMLSEMFNYGGGGGGQLPESAAAAMQLFLANPPPRSPSPPPHHQVHHHHQPPPTHMLLPSQQFTWVPGGGGGGVVEGQRLSLSLSSNLEAAKVEEELRMSAGAGGEMVFFSNQEMGAPSTSNSTTIKSFGGQHGQTQHFYGLGQHQSHFGFGSSFQSASPAGVVNVLRNSKYTRPAQELLEEFCSVGRGHLRKNRFTRNSSANAAAASTSGSGGVGPSSNSGKDPPPPLSPADRMEHQRRKVKLLAMLDEVERRYSHYCEQMQMVVNSFDVVMGFGAAIPYTALAQRAMSRHFRCLKESIQSQLKHSCELLGEKDASTSMGLTKGETPRLKALEQSLRQQRAFHQMGIMEQEAWRPQRGLPERSVNVLRAWLFEHFLHPYPSDADKHLLARQTGLSRNQVSNWFINARVRLWKPMVEDMYQQEANDNDDDEDQQANNERESNNNNTQTPTPKRSHIDASESDPPFVGTADRPQPVGPAVSDWEGCSNYGDHNDDGGVAGPQMIRFGAAAGGDVSLTLGLRHNAATGAAGNPPEKGGFTFREFGS